MLVNHIGLFRGNPEQLLQERPSAPDLHLLGVSVESYPRLAAMGYVSNHHAPKDAEYFAFDLDDPTILYRIITLTRLEPGWWETFAVAPCYSLTAPAPFMQLEEIHADT